MSAAEIAEVEQISRGRLWAFRMKWLAIGFAVPFVGVAIAGYALVRGPR